VSLTMLIVHPESTSSTMYSAAGTMSDLGIRLCCESEFAQVTERNPGVRMRVTACDLVWCNVLW
jgi:hypothetical protein